jgi:hypothetical protein
VFTPINDDCVERCTRLRPCTDNACPAPRHATITVIDRQKGSTAILVRAWIPSGNAVPQPQATGLTIAVNDYRGRTGVNLTLPPDAFEAADSAITLAGTRSRNSESRALRRFALSNDESVGSVQLQATLRGRSLIVPSENEPWSLAVTFGGGAGAPCFDWSPLRCRLTLATWSADGEIKARRRYHCAAVSKPEAP